MRLTLKLGPTDEALPFNHLPQLTSTINRWLGHVPDRGDYPRLLSFGWLQNGRKEGASLAFRDGATWRLSFFSERDGKKVLESITSDPYVGYGLYVKEAVVAPVPVFGTSYRFQTDLAPILLRRFHVHQPMEFVLWHDAHADEMLTRKLRCKMASAGMFGEHMKTRVHFDRNYKRAHSKLVVYKERDYRGSVCPVMVEGTPEALAFAWLVGLGELCHLGFGALR